MVTLQIPGQRAMHQPHSADLWLQKTTRTAWGGQDSCGARPTRLPPPQHSGHRQIDEAETRSVLSLAQILAASWVTGAHQYPRKYSLEGGQLGPAQLAEGRPDQCPRIALLGKTDAECGEGWGQEGGQVTGLTHPACPRPHTPQEAPSGGPSTACNWTGDRRRRGGCRKSPSPGTLTSYAGGGWKHWVVCLKSGSSGSDTVSLEGHVRPLRASVSSMET